MKQNQAENQNTKASKKRRPRKIITAFLTLMLCMALPLSSAQAQLEPERYTRVEIKAEKEQVTAGETITVATTIYLESDWHVYWLNPGDSGLPVIINWKKPEGFEFSDIMWPTPDKISYEILANYGYYNEVTLLQTLEVPENFAGGEVRLDATIDMLVCNDICIPESSNITLTLNADSPIYITSDARINEAKEKLPTQIDGDLNNAFTFTEVEINGEKTLRLQLRKQDLPADITEQLSNVEFFPENLGIISHISEPSVKSEDDQIIIEHKRGDQPLPEMIQGLLVIKSKIKGSNIGYQVKIKNNIDESQTSPDENTAPTEQNSGTETMKDTSIEPDVTWISALYLAFFGGILLNLMPCVFPVLSIKALSLIKLDATKQKQARIQGVAYAAGVILSFIAIGGLLVLLRNAGNAIGWGFQLQNPMVIAVLAYLLFAIGLNLIGFFELGTRISNIGGRFANSNSVNGSFFTGVLATIVATPCTAPFMGAAMGFAITQSATVSLSVFALLGFGMAAPYLLLSFIPAFRRALPKPGPWMEVFKQFLAFPMFASSIWLIWVLNNQAGPTALITFLLGLLSITFAVWLTHHSKNNSKNIILKMMIIIFALVIPLATVTMFHTKPEVENKTASKDLFYEIFTQEKLAAALQTNQPVFVELTADWCITCKFNHSVAINIESTKTIIEDKNIIFLQGDWTNKNEEITEYLASFKRNGVPLYVYYAKPDPETMRRPPPEVLPQILTIGTLQKTLHKG